MGNELLDILREYPGVYRSGVFTALSGQQLEYYLDIRAAYARPELTDRIAAALTPLIPSGTVSVAGLGAGGHILAHAVAKAAGTFFTGVRDKPKEYGTASQLFGYIPQRNDCIVIADDVFTSGTSFSKATAVLELSGCTIARRIVVVARNEPDPALNVHFLYRGADFHRSE